MTYCPIPSERSVKYILRCQTIGQCMMLNADVRKGEGVGQMRTPADRGRGYEKGSFLRTSFMDDP